MAIEHNLPLHVSKVPHVFLTFLFCLVQRDYPQACEKTRPFTAGMKALFFRTGTS